MNNTILTLTAAFTITFASTAWAEKETVVETTAETPVETTWTSPFAALSWEHDEEAAPTETAVATTAVEISKDEKNDAVAAVEAPAGPLALTDEGRGYLDLKPFARGVRETFLALAEGES